MKILSELFYTNTAFAMIYIMVISLVVSAIVDLIVTRLLRKLAKKTKNQLDDIIIQTLRRPLASTVVIVGAAFALQRLGYEGTIPMVSRGVLITLAVVLWASAGMKIAMSSLDALAQKADTIQIVQPRTQPLFEIIAKILVVAGAAYGILLAWNVDVTAWLASAGILGIAVGFAAKDTLSNFFSGIFILADAPYKIGDFVILGTGERGMVTDIGIRSTRLLTRDDIQVIVPNASIGNAKIVNETGGPHDMERVRLTVGVAYDSDVDQVKEVLMSAAADCQYIVDEPTPRVRFREFLDSSMKFQLMGWIDEPVLRGRALDELHTLVIKRFRKEGIVIPYPQRRVWLHPQED